MPLKVEFDAGGFNAVILPIMRTGAIILLITLFTNLGFSQDSTKAIKAIKDTGEVKAHSPTKAAIFSAVLPGLGQAYNKKYWKIPIIYAAFGGIGYAIDYNLVRYNRYHTAYKLRVDGDPSTVDQYANSYSDADLLTLKKFYRRNLDVSVIGATMIYALNIIDAIVDAHLFNFDVSDDLSLSLAPYSYLSRQKRIYPGLTLKFNL